MDPKNVNVLASGADLEQLLTANLEELEERIAPWGMETVFPF